MCSVEPPCIICRRFPLPTHLQTLLGKDSSAASHAAHLGHVGQDLPAGVELVRAEPDVGGPEPLIGKIIDLLFRMTGSQSNDSMAQIDFVIWGRTSLRSSWRRRGPRNFRRRMRSRRRGRGCSPGIDYRELVLCSHHFENNS